MSLKTFTEPILPAIETELQRVVAMLDAPRTRSFHEMLTYHMGWSGEGAGPEAVASDWVGNEITYATLAQKTIVPLHVKPCEIPIGLVKKQYIDFEKKTHKEMLKELMGILKPVEV